MRGAIQRPSPRPADKVDFRLGAAPESRAARGFFTAYRGGVVAVWKGAVPSKQEQRAQKRKAMLRVAARIFNKKGYHNTSLDEIAEELGVTKAALYYYVSGKDELLYECIKLSHECGRRARVAAEAHEGSALERLRILYGQLIVNLIEEQGAYSTSGDILALPQAQREELLEARRIFDRYSRQLLSAAAAEGSLREGEVRLTSNFVLGAINWILRWHSPEETRTPAQIAESFLDLIFNGIAAH